MDNKCKVIAVVAITVIGKVICTCLNTEKRRFPI